MLTTCVQSVLRRNRQVCNAFSCMRRSLGDEKPSKLRQLIALSTPANHRQVTIVSSGDIPKFSTYKRHQRKRSARHTEEAQTTDKGYCVRAYSTAEEYDLEGIADALKREFPSNKRWKFLTTDSMAEQQNALYTSWDGTGEQSESKDAFLFRDGSVILWNFDESEARQVLRFLKMYEKDSYAGSLVIAESERMPYRFLAESSPCIDKRKASVRKGRFYLSPVEFSDDNQNVLEKYTFSNAMAASTKLAVWEAKLDQYIDSMEMMTQKLKLGRRLGVSRSSALRKTGELFALRRLINLSSDLLDTPDFYWDHENLESLYVQVCSYYSVTRRVNVMNEKLNHCVALAELILDNANEAHMVRLEWVVIVLIMISVGFEVLHYMH